MATLPEYDETTPSRTVVALNLPLERPTIEGVAEIFSECGEIVLIRILRPGNPVPADVKPFANKHPEMTDKTCALVEFERTEFAHKAVRELNDDDKDEGLKVMEMTAPPPKTTKSKEDKKKAQQLQQLQQHAHQQLLFKQQQGVFQQSLAGQQQRRFSHAGFNIPPHHPQSSEQMVLAPHHQQAHQPPRRRISLYHNMKFTPIAEEQQHKAEHSLNPNAPTFQMQQQQQQQLPPRRLSRPHMHPMEAAAHAAAMQHQAAAAAAAAAAIMHGQPPVPAHHGPSPWMMRRLSGMHAPDFASASGLTLPPNVVRLPRGPDKGKGFQKWCRSRMEPTGQQAAAAASLPQKKKSHAVPIVAPPAEEEEEKPQPENVEGAAAAAPAADKKEEEAAKEEEVAAPAAAVAEPQVDGAAALPAPAAAAAAVEGDAALVLANDSCSDSGNEDGSVSSEPDVEAAAAADNERSR